MVGSSPHLPGYATVGPVDFRVEAQPQGALTVVTVEGELDVHTAPQLSSALDGIYASGQAVVVDLSGVPFMDSTGLSVFVTALKRTKEADGQLGLVVTEPAVLKVFTITGLDTVLAVHDSLDAALVAVK